MRRVVKDIINGNIEHKYGTVSVAETVVTTAGSVKLITQNITQGDDVNNRTGDMITIDHLKLVINVRNTDTAATNIFSTRIILFADNLNVGAAPAVGDVLNSAALTSGYSPISASKNRFRIYADFIIDSVSNTNTATVSKDLTYKINRKCFFSAASGSSSNGKGSLFMLEICNFASANNVMSYGWELKYSDA
jgi:hypothetical protein